MPEIESSIFDHKSVEKMGEEKWYVNWVFICKLFNFPNQSKSISMEWEATPKEKKINAFN